MGALVESVNVGVVIPTPYGRKRQSAIDKRPVSGSVHVHTLGVDGDETGDTDVHGGADQAVYAYAGEDLDAWSTTLDRELRPGQFGENLTTRGIDVNQSRIGDRWRVGGALLEISAVRVPCATFQGFLEEPHWVKKFALGGVPGAYFRVIEEGDIRAGDSIEVVEQREHDLTVGMVFRVLTTERARLAELAIEPRFSAAIRWQVDQAIDNQFG